jgi:hypothetical protein
MDFASKQTKGIKEYTSHKEAFVKKIAEKRNGSIL